MKKIIILLTILTLVGCSNNQEKSRNIFYMDTYINVKIYTDNPNIDYIYDNINNIYKEYDNLCNRYEEYENLVNVYYLNEILKNDEEINIDPKLSEIINYGLEYYSKTDGLFNIAIGNVSAIWKKYMEEKKSVPSIDELKNTQSININDISLTNNIYKKRNGVKLDLGGLCKGYATEVVGNYIESLGIKKYLINAGGNVKVGEHYNKDKYVIGIQHPENDTLLTKIKANNVSVVTSGDYQRYYEVSDIRYNHIINPKTLYPANYSKGVTVITSSSAYADIMSTYLFLLNPSDAINLVNSTDNLEAIIYVDENTILKSEGFNKYEEKWLYPNIDNYLNMHYNAI